MTGIQLFESLQYLDDTLLNEEAPRQPAVTKWRLPCAVAACLVLAVLVAALVHVPRTGADRDPVPPHMDPATIGPTQGAGGEADRTQPQPGGVPGPEAADSAPKPTVFAWNELDVTARSPEVDLAAGVIQVSEPLTAAQTASCAPEIREAWMEDFDGFAAYYLHDGTGGLAFIEMTVRNAEWGGTYTVRLRDAEAPETPDCIVRPQPETDRVGSLNGQEYRAYRVTYSHGEGDPALSPPEPWTEMTVVFEKENVVYSLMTDAPESEAERAAMDLQNLLLCYVGTHGTPDLDAFRYGDYLLRDETQTLDEALADPDFGAYLPADGPDGFAFDFARRYQFEEVANYLMVFWMRGGAHLQWIVRPVTEEALSRVVAPEERERYDLSLYPVPWSAYAAQENRTTVENPVFRIGELTPELVGTRVHAGDEGLDMFRFCVLYESGVLVEVSAKGVSADWVYEALKRLG